MVYPDADAEALLSAASALTGKPAAAILEDFGEFLAPDLLQMYGALLDPSWNITEIAENTEETIHQVVRRRDPGAHPPRLRCSRKSPEEVVITYDSPRRMCGLAKGLVRGIAAERGERVAIQEEVCMLSGDDRCEITVRRVGPGA